MNGKMPSSPWLPKGPIAILYPSHEAFKIGILDSKLTARIAKANNGRTVSGK